MIFYVSPAVTGACCWTAQAISSMRGAGAVADAVMACFR